MSFEWNIISSILSVLFIIFIFRTDRTEIISCLSAITFMVKCPASGIKVLSKNENQVKFYVSCCMYHTVQKSYVH